MRRLFLLRHASADNGSSGGDHERKLSPDGVRAAAKLGGYLGRQPGDAVSCVLCSSAERCVETLAEIRPHLPEQIEVRIDRALYLASPEALLQTIAAADDEHAGVLVMAHNPGIAEFAIELATSGDPETRSRMLRGFPPAALAGFELDIEHWSQASAGSARLFDFVRVTDLE